MPRLVSGDVLLVGCSGCFWFFSGDTGQNQQRSGWCPLAGAQYGSDVSGLWCLITCCRILEYIYIWGFFGLYIFVCWVFFLIMWVTGNKKIIRTQFHLTSPILCIGNVDKTIHHLAHLLHLWGRGVDWAACLIWPFKNKKLTADGLPLCPSLFSLCPAWKHTKRSKL